MGIFDQLQNGKGTVSSALGKELAARALQGDLSVLEEALVLTVYDLPRAESKHIRAGAAKIIEIVAEKRADLVAHHLEALLPALDAPEPQTRWMILRTFGLCASLAPDVAAKAIPFASREIQNKEGLIVASSADLYLGDLGAASPQYAKSIFSILKVSAMSVIKNEADWILEAFTAMCANLGDDEGRFVAGFAREYVEDTRKSTRKRAEKLMKLLNAAKP